MNNLIDKTVFEILHKMNFDNYKSYLVGGVVRNYLLGESSNDIDICTNIPLDILISLFHNCDITKYNGVRFQYNRYNFDVSQLRYEKLVNNKISVCYTDSLELDSSRRDFTVNAIYMDQYGNIYDFHNGLRDLKLKMLKCIGNPQNRFIEDPTRILRAIKFSIIYDFSFDSSLDSEILNSHDYLNSLDSTYLLYNFCDLIKSVGFDKFIQFNDNYNIFKLPSFYIKTHSLVCFFSQIYLFNAFLKFSKKNILLFQKINKITQYGSVDHYIVFHYGLISVMYASKILNINMNYIYGLIKTLPIKNLRDVKVSLSEIASYLKSDIDDRVKNIYNKIVDLVLYDKLQNDRDSIYNFLQKEKYKYGF